MRKSWGAGGIFSVWTRQCFEHIYKAVLVRMVPVAGHTHSFPFCSSRMTLTLVTNFPIFLSIGPIAAQLGHQFLTLKCPSDNSMEKREVTLPLSVTAHTLWRCWEEMHTPLRNFVPATLLVTGLETRDMDGVVTKLSRNGHYKLSDSLAPTGCPTIQFDSDNNYRELASD